jgi:hypothetical protein
MVFMITTDYPEKSFNPLYGQTAAWSKSMCTSGYSNSEPAARISIKFGIANLH